MSFRYGVAHGAPVRKTRGNQRKQKKTLVFSSTQRAQRTQRFLTLLPLCSLCSLCSPSYYCFLLFSLFSPCFSNWRLWRTLTIRTLREQHCISHPPHRGGGQGRGSSEGMREGLLNAKWTVFADSPLFINPIHGKTLCHHIVVLIVSNKKMKNYYLNYCFFPLESAAVVRWRNCSATALSVVVVIDNVILNGDS